MRVIAMGLFLVSIMACSSLEQTVYQDGSQFSYVSDQELYGVRDYWPTTNEFLRLGQGDCEAFAAYYAAKFNVPVIIGVVKNAAGRFEGHAWVVVDENIIDNSGIHSGNHKAYRAMYAITDWDKAALLQQKSVKEGNDKIFIEGIQPYMQLVN